MPSSNDFDGLVMDSFFPLAVKLSRFDQETSRKMDNRFKTRLIIQSTSMIWLILAQDFHLAEVGIIGLSIIMGMTALNGILEEHGRA